MSRMHDDEIASDAALVRRLLGAQFPHWATLDIAPVASSGTDNAMYRLGDELAVRLPRRPAAAIQLAKEHAWLPRLAPQLPLAIPLPLAKGLPCDDYPWAWSVCRWLDGETADRTRIAEPKALASDLARFIAALRATEAQGGPRPGAHNFWRGVALAARDRHTRAAIASLQGVIDAGAALAAWARDMQAPAWHDAPVWIHGDLSAGNLLMTDGRLSGVIDFGGLCVGDPACDLMVAWSLFDGESRDAFRAALGVDDASWARGRGWALSAALLALAYYRTGDAKIAADAERTINAVLGEGG